METEAPEHGAPISANPEHELKLAVSRPDD